MKIMLLLAVALLLSSLAVAQDGGEDDKTAEAKPSSWVCVTEEAAFSPRDTAEDCVFDGKMWISNGYYHGGVLTRDLWWTTDGETWTRVSEATPYDGTPPMASTGRRSSTRPPSAPEAMASLSSMTVRCGNWAAARTSGIRPTE